MYLNIKHLFFIFFVLPVCLKAQNSISGKVQDIDGEDIMFSSIYLENKKIFTHSLSDGSFFLKLDDDAWFNDTLVVKFSGYNTIRTPIHYQSKNIILNKIILRPKMELLPEVKVIAPPPVEDIMKTAIKRIKKNYINETTQLEGFYRETSFENDSCIMINEAVINVEYSHYNNKVNLNNQFNDYYKNQATNLRDIGSIFRYSQFFPFYTTKEDKVFIPYSRKSYNLSLYKNNPSPYGGPNDVLAMDKVKFLYDFFDPKMISKYNYKNLGKEEVNGIVCYKISYTPKIETKESKNKVWHPIDSKMSYPIFSGFIYISVDDYAILSFVGQKYILVDFSVYSKPYPYFAYPDFLTFQVNYQKNKDNKYVLTTVETEQIRTIRYNNDLIRYKSERILSLYETEKILFNDESQRFFYGNNTSLRNFVGKYDTLFWMNYEVSNKYISLKEKYIAQLQIKNSLHTQFLEQNKTILDIESPHFIEIKAIFDNRLDSIQYYQELKTEYDSLLGNYISNENRYYNGVMEKLKNYKRYYSYNYFHAFNDKDSTNGQNNSYIDDSEKIYVKVDTNNHYIWYDKESNKKVVDFTSISRDKQNFFLEDIQLNHSDKIAIQYSENGNISSHLNIFEYENDSVIYKDERITQFFWKTDSTFIYVQTDLTERPFLVLETNINRKQTDTLFKLENREMELVLIHDESGTLIQVENKNETDCYVLNSLSNKFEAKVPPHVSTSFNVLHFDSNNIILIELRDTHQLRYGNSTHNNYTNLPVIYKTNNAIEEVKVTKDFIVFTERHKGSFQLKAINVNSKKVMTVESIPQYASISIDQTSKNTNDVLFSVATPLMPFHQLKINMDSKQIDTVNIDSVADNFDSSNFHYKYEEIPINDSISVPVTILYNNTFKDSLKGLLIKTYGTYGSIDFPTYDVDHLIYANAGIGVVFVHPRGSGEKGYKWHTEGQKLNKKNTFLDYLSCVEQLKDRFKLNQNQIIGYGSSAGGLSMGVAANLRPDLFGGLVFDKPYVNVLDIMSNENLPLTTLEYGEFGNIKNENVYNYIKSYAPIENLKEGDYPNILVLNKYHDMNTPYWNAVKYVVNYRKKAKNSPLILMNTDLQAGHRGNINGLVEIDYQADTFAFIMYIINKNE